MKKIYPVKSLRNSRGFTLIEMSIVVAILGLSLAAFIPFYQSYTHEKSQATTKTNVDTIASAIGDFKATYGRYPCPASLTAIPGSAQYGHEDCGAALATYNGAIDAARGQYGQTSSRTVTYKNPYAAFASTTAKPPIRTGFIPFRELNLDEKQAYDAYGDRVEYSVTEHLAFATSFDPTTGGVEVIDANGNSVVPAFGQPGATGHFFIASLGEDGVGAYTQGGTQKNAALCGAGASLQSNNCNFQATNSFRAAQATSVAGAGHFDDVVAYYTQNEMPLWQVSTVAGAATGAIVQKAGGNVGFNVANVNSALSGKGDVNNGAIRAQQDATGPAGLNEGHVMTQSLCEKGTANCFSTNLIAGDLTAGTGGIKCPAATPFMVGIANGQPKCVAELVASCGGATPALQGINPDGTLNCGAAPPACVPTTSSVDCASVGQGDYGVINYSTDCNGIQTVSSNTCGYNPTDPTPYNPPPSYSGPTLTMTGSTCPGDPSRVCWNGSGQSAWVIQGCPGCIVTGSTSSNVLNGTTINPNDANQNNYVGNQSGTNPGVIALHPTDGGTAHATVYDPSTGQTYNLSTAWVPDTAANAAAIAANQAAAAAAQASANAQIACSASGGTMTPFGCFH